MRDEENAVAAENGEQTKRGRPALSEFGVCLYTMMLSKGVRTATRLAELMSDLDDDGDQVSHQTISAYWTGKRPVPAEFTRKAAEALELDEDERTKLAYALVYRKQKQGGAE